MRGYCELPNGDLIVPRARIKRLFCKVRTSSEILLDPGYLISQAATELARQLLAHDKVLVTESEDGDGNIYTFDVSVIIPLSP